jgi:hypothetical protein
MDALPGGKFRIQLGRKQPARVRPDFNCVHVSRRRALVARAKNVEGVQYRGIEGIDREVRRKENVAALIQHMTAEVGHGALPCAVQAGAHVSLCRWLPGGGPLPAMKPKVGARLPIRKYEKYHGETCGWASVKQTTASGTVYIGGSAIHLPAVSSLQRGRHHTFVI